MKTMVDNAKIARMEKNIADLQAGGGGGSEQANWINYHVEIKAGGPVTIKDPVEIGNYTIYGRDLYSHNMFEIKSGGDITSGLSDPHNIYEKTFIYAPALYQFNVAKIDKTGEFVKFYGSTQLSNYNSQAVLRYGDTRSYYCFSDPNIITEGDYTLTVVYGLGKSDSPGSDGFVHISSDFNSAKIHMVVSTDTAGNKTIKMADGETGIVLKYTDGTPLESFYYLLLIDVQLSKGWTE